DPIDFFELAGREIFIRVETPASFQQALAAQDLVDACDTAAEMVGGVEECRVRVGNFVGEDYPVMPDAMVPLRTYGFEYVNHPPGPHSPVSQQSACELHVEQIEQDMIVFARIQRDLAAASGFANSAYHLESLVTVE